MAKILMLQKKFQDIIDIIEELEVSEDLIQVHQLWNTFSEQLKTILFNKEKENEFVLADAKLVSIEKTMVDLCPSDLGKPGTLDEETIINDSETVENITNPIILEQLEIERTNTNEKHADTCGTNDLNIERTTNSNDETQEEVNCVLQNDHVKLVEGVKHKQFICEECGAMFNKKGNFNVHLRKHSGMKPFACTKCPFKSTSSSNLRRHLLSHQGLKPFLCTICDARFTEKKSMLQHTRQHTQEKPFTCKTCGKSYASQWVLSQHTLTHKGPEGKSHLCHQCGKSFTQKSQLKLHEKRHSGIKPHICSYCGIAFTTKSDLNRHERTHSCNNSGKRSFVCDQCGKSFGRSHRLKEHLLKHQTANVEEESKGNESINK